MIDRTIKRSLGQMMKGVQVVAATDGTITRGYCSHWVCQISFDEPIVLASCSPKHDTHPLIVATRRFAVSILAADQVEIGQYFSYPGRKFRYMAPEYLSMIDGWPVVPDAIAWLGCEVFETALGKFDHDLFSHTSSRLEKVGSRRRLCCIRRASAGAPPETRRANLVIPCVIDYSRLADLGIDEVGADDEDD